jgi:3-dehydroquinate synthase
MSNVPENNIYRTIDLNGCRIHFTDLESLSEFINDDYKLSENDFVLADSNTAKHCYPILKKISNHLNEDHLIIIEPGEEEKNITSLHHIWNFLQHAGANRDSRLFNLGGGMITDIGGFAASTYKRGIPFIHIPTSLMGMVDAAIGGKTAINLGQVKNQVGSFSLPEAVLIHHGFLLSLPWEEFHSGYAEIIKISLTFDSSLWQLLRDIHLTEHGREKICQQLGESICFKAASLKSRVVSRDFIDGGERQCLNFGHSIGHALEAFFLGNGKELKHGLAVAVGMICESYISTQILDFEIEEAEIIKEYILKNFPKIDFGERDIDDIMILLKHDKKNLEKEIIMSLLSAPGKCVYGTPCPEEIIRDSLSYYINLS